MTIEKPEGLTPEQREQERKRAINTGEMLEHGAEYTERGELKATEQQIKMAEREMETEFFTRKLSQAFSPDEITELETGLGLLLEKTGSANPDRNSSLKDLRERIFAARKLLEKKELEKEKRGEQS